MTKTRLQVAKHWFSGRRNGVSFTELISYFFASSYATKANAIISGMTMQEEYALVALKDIDTPVYYPAQLDLRSLRQVIVESFYADNWHYYQTDGTRIEPGDIVVDCGAAEGIFSLIAAKNAKHVYAIEPSISFNKALSLTFANIENVEILQCAVSSSIGNAYFNDADISSSVSFDGRGAPVRVETLDELFYERAVHVDYIKADLEGHDYEALRGARRLIETCRPKIAVTTYHDPDHAKLIADYLTGIHPEYRIRTKGIYQRTGSPVMLHAWSDKQKRIASGSSASS